MSDPNWLEEGETVLGSWSVYVVLALSAGNAFAGKIYVTDKFVRFDSQFQLGNVEDAGLVLVQDGKLISIPYDQIAKSEIKKQFLVMKNLVLTLKNGDAITFRFGAMSPAKANQAILPRIS